MTQLQVSLHEDKGRRAPCETLGLRAAPRGPRCPRSGVRLEDQGRKLWGHRSGEHGRLTL